MPIPMLLTISVSAIFERLGSSRRAYSWKTPSARNHFYLANSEELALWMGPNGGTVSNLGGPFTPPPPLVAC